jgi:hypothetical protein
MIAKSVRSNLTVSHTVQSSADRHTLQPHVQNNGTGNDIKTSHTNFCLLQLPRSVRFAPQADPAERCSSTVRNREKPNGLLEQQ